MLLVVLGVALHLFLVRPLYLGARRLAWALSGEVERDVPAEPVTEDHPRFVARLAAPTGTAAPFALGGDGRVLVVPDGADAFGLFDPATARRTGRLRRSGSCGLATAVDPDGLLLADLGGARCHLAVVHPLTGAGPVEVVVRHPSAALDTWLAGGPRGCEEEVTALGLAAVTADAERPLVVVTALQCFVGPGLDEPGPAAVLVRTYDVAAPGAPLLAETLHPRPDPDDGRVVLSPDTRLVAVGGGAAVEVLDRVTGRVVCRLDDDPGRPLAFSPDGHLLVCARHRTTAEGGLVVTRCTVSVWDVPAGRRRSHWVEPRSGVSCAAVADGLVAVGATSGEEVRHRSWRGTATVHRHRSSVAVHRVDDGALLDDLPVRSDRLAFAAGGRLVVSGAGGLTVWEVGSAPAPDGTRAR